MLTQGKEVLSRSRERRGPDQNGFAFQLSVVRPNNSCREDPFFAIIWARAVPPERFRRLCRTVARENDIGREELKNPKRMVINVEAKAAERFEVLLCHGHFLERDFLARNNFRLPRNVTSDKISQVTSRTTSPPIRLSGAVWAN